MSQPFHQLQPLNNTIYDENVSINASHNVAVYTLGMMTTPPQASWDGRGHVLMQPFESKLSESGADTVQQLPIHNDSLRLYHTSFNPNSYYKGLQMTNMHPQPQQPSQYSYDGINSEIAQSYGLATGPLHYDPSSNIGSFYRDFSKLAMVNSKDTIVLPLGIDDEPHRETLLADEDITLDQHMKQHLKGTFKFKAYQWPPKKRSRVTIGRVEKTSSWSQASSLALSKAHTVVASVPPKPNHLDLKYDKKNTRHQQIINSARQAITSDALNKHCLMDEPMRKQLVLEELRASTISEYCKDEGFTNNWAVTNADTLYMELSAPYKCIMHMLKRMSTMPEPNHQAAIVEFLINSTNCTSWKMELCGTINAVVELGLKPHLEELDKLFCAAVAAVKCTVMKLRSGRFVEMDFIFWAFEDMYKALMNYIRARRPLAQGQKAATAPGVGDGMWE
ncbi:hypothetical protein EDD22DRAFT_851554 [Suillus occidentalis]|nr:hypothetical protein EDD22DRAFT_851554 [Suillus occidentalis]